MGASLSSHVWSEDAQPTTGSSATSHHGSDSNGIVASNTSSASPKPSMASSKSDLTNPVSVHASEQNETSDDFQVVTKRSSPHKRKLETPSPSKLATMPYKIINNKKISTLKSSHSAQGSCEGDKSVSNRPSHSLPKLKQSVPLIVTFKTPEDYTKSTVISDDFKEFQDCQHLNPHHHRLLDNLIEKEQAKAALVTHSDKKRRIIRAVHAHLKPKFNQKLDLVSKEKIQELQSRKFTRTLRAQRFPNSSLLMVNCMDPSFDPIYAFTAEESLRTSAGNIVPHEHPDKDKPVDCSKSPQVVHHIGQKIVTPESTSPHCDNGPGSGETSKSEKGPAHHALPRPYWLV